MTAVWPRALAAWAIMAAAMTLNGIVRVKMLTPQLGQTVAGFASAALGILLIQLIARGTLVTVPPSLSQRAGIALLWLARECDH